MVLIFRAGATQIPIGQGFQNDALGLTAPVAHQHT